MTFSTTTLSPDKYIDGILQQKSRFVSEDAISSALDIVIPHIRTWAGNHLVEMNLSGSYAKKTAIGSGSDIDLFVSLSSNTPDSLTEIHTTLFTCLQRAGLSPRKQNVSIGLSINGIKIDIVPGKRQSQQGNDHTLYLRKKNSWRKTNVAKHINHVQTSGRTQEIRALKCWRDCHNLEFPTFNIELVVIHALHGKQTGQLAKNILEVLQYLSRSFIAARLTDPANTNNVVSEDMTLVEKQAVANKAKQSLQATNWNQIVW